MKIGVPKESVPGECRVAATPETVTRLKKQGFDVVIESGAGAAAGFADDAFGEGVEIATTEAAWSADVVLKVRPPTTDETSRLKEGQTLISFLFPAQNEELVEKLRTTGATVLAMDQVPRITRAQKCDALSSMANIAGYRAVVEAANQFGRFFTGQITAAGKVPPAKVMVIGAGVAGLAAIGAAKGLGAVVRAFDTRAAVKEQVESMGAEFLELDFEESGEGAGGYAKVMSKEFIEAEMALFAEQCREVDIVISTALIPGKPAPKLITREMVESMKPGSVIVDLAAEQGGNCELTEKDEIAEHKSVRIIGYTDLPSRLANQSSQLYGTNLCHLLDELGQAESYSVDLENDIIRGSIVVHQGELLWPPPAVEPSPTPEPAKPSAAPATPAPAAMPEKKHISGMLWLAAAGGGLLLVGLGSPPPEFLRHLTVFVLACIIGWQVIWNVTPALHTPLMSVTNAISGIIIIGGMLQVSGEMSASVVLGFVAILIAAINVAGGFLVTQRMLKMFHK